MHMHMQNKLYSALYTYARKLFDMVCYIDNIYDTVVW